MRLDSDNCPVNYQYQVCGKMWRLASLCFCLIATSAVQDPEYKNVSYDIRWPSTGHTQSGDCTNQPVFECDESQCIPLPLQCDGVTDCRNGRDESVETCGCLPNEFQCNATSCIENDKRCDFTNDCGNYEDEQDCETYACPVTYFKCQNHKCVPRDVMCDFVNDCGDNSDESFCVQPECVHDQFKCDNGECVLYSRLCDGVSNCKDQSDENPDNCKKEFQCSTGFYVGSKHKCDGWIECTFTHEDEMNCGECKAPGFMCKNGQCLDEAAACDQVCDCLHCEDELSCPLSYCEHTQHYLCRDTQRCLRHRHVCDGINQCKNTDAGIDEYYCQWNDCSNSSSKNFMCNDGRCLPGVFRCNHYRDCLQGDDEDNCTFPACPDGQFRCDNQKCVSANKRCDAKNDCFDWSDEKNCDSHQCPVGHAQCRSGQCVPSWKWCNLWPDCPDHSDELYCTYPYRACAEDEFRCSNGECVPASMVCYNGKNGGERGCQDKSHLINCEHHKCQENQFKCRRSFCIDQGQICDGFHNCIFDKMDEEGCEYDCPYGQDVCRCYDQEMNCEYANLTVAPLPISAEHITKFRWKGNFFNKTLTSTTFSEAKAHIHRITFIDLSDNYLTHIPEKIFLFMRRLKYLNLENNRITNLTDKSLLGLKNLTQLYLKGNMISYIQPGSFLDMGQLTILDLSYQNLSKLAPNTFLGLHSLHLLKLSGNRLMELSDGTFRGLDKLLTLDLSDNRIDTIASRVFYGIPSLSALRTDEYRFCCLAPSVKRCLPEPDEFSSCEDLMSNQVLRVFIWILGLVAFFGNLLVIAWRAREIGGRKVHAFLITNLALGDFLMGFYLIIIAMVDAYYRGEYIVHDRAWRQSHLCKFAGFISTFSSELSVLTLTIITLDRLMCILFPLRQTRLSVRDARVAMFLVWITVFLISVTPLFGLAYFWNFYGRSGVCLALHITPARPPGWEYSVAVFLVFNFASFLIIAASYIWMFVVAKETRSAVRGPESKGDLAMARRMTLIVMTDFVCWVPIILLGFVSLGGANASNYVYAWIAVFILPLNSAVNPVLYTLSTAPFLGNVRKRVRRFRKSFMNSVSLETKHSFVDDRTVNSSTGQKPITRHGETIRMKALRTGIPGHSFNQGSSDL